MQQKPGKGGKSELFTEHLKRHLPGTSQGWEVTPKKQKKIYQYYSLTCSTNELSINFKKIAIYFKVLQLKARLVNTYVV